MTVPSLNGADTEYTNSGASGTPFSFSHTVASGTDKLVVVVSISDDKNDPGTIDSVVWDSAGVNESLTKRADLLGGFEGRHRGHDASPESRSHFHRPRDRDPGQ